MPDVIKVRHQYHIILKICGHLNITSRLKPGALIGSWFLHSFPVIITSTLQSRLSTRFWSVAMGICVHAAIRALVRSGSAVGKGSLPSSQFSNAEVRPLCTRFKYSHVNLSKPCIYRAHFARRGTVMLEQVWAS